MWWGRGETVEKIAEVRLWTGGVIGSNVWLAGDVVASIGHLGKI